MEGEAVGSGEKTRGGKKGWGTPNLKMRSWRSQLAPLQEIVATALVKAQLGETGPLWAPSCLAHLIQQPEGVCVCGGEMELSLSPIHSSGTA